MKYLEYLKYSPILIAVVLFFLWSNSKNKCSRLEAQKIEWKIDSTSLNAELLATKDFVNKLQTTMTRKEVYTQEKIGSIHKEYGSKLSRKDKLIARALDKNPDTVLIENTYTHIKELEDSFKTADLDLKYLVFYKGSIESIDFDYTVKEKTIIQDHVIFEYVDRPVYLAEKKSYYYASYSFGGVVHDLEFGYVSKNRIGFKAELSLFDKKLYPKIGAVILF